MASYTDIVSAKEELWSLITKAELLIETDYTKSSWAIFKAQEQLAIDLYNNEDATLDQINSMIDMMNGISGFGGLKSSADLTELRNQILRAQSLTKQNYNPNDWNNLQLVLNDAIEVYDSIDPTQDEVDEAANNLRDFLDGLVPEDNPIDIEGSNVRFRWGNLADYEDPSLLSDPRNDTLYFTNQGQLFKGIVPISSVVEISSTSKLPPISLTDSNGNTIYNDGSTMMLHPKSILTNHKIYTHLQSDGTVLMYYTSGGSYYNLDLESLDVSKLKGILPMSNGGVGSDLSLSVGKLDDYDHLLKYDTATDEVVASYRGIDYIYQVDVDTTVNEKSPLTLYRSIDTDKSSPDAGKVLIKVTHKESPGYYHIPSGGKEHQVLSYDSDGKAKWHNISYDEISNTPEIPEITLTSSGDGYSLIIDGKGPDLSIKNLYSKANSGILLANKYYETIDNDGVSTKIPMIDMSIDPSIIPDKSIIQSITNNSVIVYAASTKNIDITNPGESLSLDESVVPPQSLVLIKDQSNEAENGIYKYTVSDNSYQLVRSTPLELSSDFESYKSIIVKVESGTTQSDTYWISINNGKLIKDISPIKFHHLSGTVKIINSGGGSSIAEGDSEIQAYLGDWLFQGNLEGSVLENLAGKPLYGKFCPYLDVVADKMMFYYGSTNPMLGANYSSSNPSTSLSNPERLNFNGVLYATQLYSEGTKVSIEGHSHDMSTYFNNNKGNGYTSYDYDEKSGVASNPDILAGVGGAIQPTDSLMDAIGRLEYRINTEVSMIVVNELPEWNDSYINKLVIVVDGGYTLESDNESIVITDTPTGANIDIVY